VLRLGIAEFEDRTKKETCMAKQTSVERKAWGLGGGLQQKGGNIQGVFCVGRGGGGGGEKHILVKDCSKKKKSNWWEINRMETTKEALGEGVWYEADN